MRIRTRSSGLAARRRTGGFEVARALRAPLDLVFVRKIGAPGHAEFGLGAVVDGAHPQVVLNEEALGHSQCAAGLH